MVLRKISKELNNNHILKIPNDQQHRKIQIELDSSSSIPLIYFDVHLKRENQQKSIFIFKDIDPQSIWHRNGFRDGDRLLTIDDQHCTSMTGDEIHSFITEKTTSFICEIIWHPEVFLELNTDGSPEHEKDQHDLTNFNQSTLYPSITELVRHLLTFRPKQPEKFSIPFDTPEEISLIDNRSLVEAQQRLLLSNRSDAENNNTDEIMRNLLETNHSFERIACGLNEEEICWIWLSMKNFLQKQTGVQKLRFWGKIFGIQHDYYIIEADLDSFDGFDLNDPEFIKYQEAFDEEEENSTNEKKYQQRKVPPELIGDGINQKLFFVSNGATEPFIQLPLLTPKQVELSRSLQRFFTGDLEALVESSYPGVEKHLLRAHIQRISAGTQIGPKNYFQVPTISDDEVEEETINSNDPNEIVGDRMRFDINPKFHGNKLEDLALPYGEYWVHCAPYIYQQGQTNFHQRSLHTDDILLKSPNPLSPLNEDQPINHSDPAWSVKISSTLVPEHSLISVRSNRWPGAYAVGDREQFKNIYIGWGLKNFEENHLNNRIALLPTAEYAYELIEIDDPTVDEENFLLQSSVFLSPEEEFETTSELE